MKRLLTVSGLFILLCLLLAVPCAAEDLASGSCGSSAVWVLREDGELLISGSGTVESVYIYSLEDLSGPWYEYRSRIKRVTVGEGITELDSEVLSDLPVCTEIQLPSTLKTCQYGFNDCPKLTELHIPAGLTILNSGFFGCDALQRFTVDPENPAFSAADGALYNKSGDVLIRCPTGKAGTFTLPGGVKDFAYNAFLGCRGITGFAVEADSTAFCAVEGLLCDRERKTLRAVPGGRQGLLTIPEGIITVGAYAAALCEGLTGFTAPSSLETIGESAFFKTGLKTLTLERSITLGREVFSWCADLEQVQITADELPEYCFYECSGLKRAMLGEGLRKLGSFAFTHTALEEITLPDSVTELGGYVFYECGSLKTVTLPQGLTRIGDTCFYQCASLTEITIPRGVSGIPYLCFYGCSALKTVRLSEGLTSIGYMAFEYAGIENLLLPKSLTFISDYAFYNCASLTGLHFLGDCPRMTEQSGLSSVELCHLESAAGWDEPLWEGMRTCVWSYSFRDTATCAEGGETSYTCAHCGVSFTYPERPGHRFGDWFVLQTPTVETEGTMERNCTRCGQKQTQTIPKRTKTEQTPIISNNLEDSYQRARRSSCLIARPDGGFDRVEAGESSSWEDPFEPVTVELWDADFHCRSGFLLPRELPYYGGCYAGSDYNFILYGDRNEEELDSKEVFRLVYYSKDWVRLYSVSLYGENTTYPFNSGSVDMTQDGDVLYIRTAHTMYRYVDGLRHQANVSIVVGVSQKTVMEARTGISSAGTGYVSHSFNERIITDGEDVICADLGDAYPRAIALLRSPGAVGAPTLGSFQELDVLPIYADIGNNYTGASLSGLSVSDDCYLVAGRSVLQDEAHFYDGMKNVFVTASDKQTYSSETTTLRWFTDARTEEEQPSTPRLVQVERNRFLLLWHQQGKLHYLFLNGRGEPVSREYTSALARISECEPVVSGRRVVWYYTGNSKPSFCWLDLDHPEQLTVLHEHAWQVEITQTPYSNTAGKASVRCVVCGENGEIELPPTSDQRYRVTVTTEPSCEDWGWADYSWDHPQYGTVTFFTYIYPLDHDYVAQPAVMPTETADGSGAVVCSRCGETLEDQTIYRLSYEYYTHIRSLEPTCDEPGREEYSLIFYPSYRLELELPPLGHDWSQVTYAWSEDLSTVTASRVCRRDGSHTESETAGTSAAFTRPADCEHGSETTYSASFANPAFKPQSRRLEDDDAIGHDWGEPSYVWSGDDLTVTAARSCRHDPAHVDSETVKVQVEVLLAPTLDTEGEAIYTAHFSNPVFAEQSKNVTLPRGERINPFTDVTSQQFFYEPVLWAFYHEPQITNGMDATTFAPGSPCTRGQVVTFLWRAAGMPEPTSSNNPFTDVSAQKFYYNAVLWAVEKGITNGMSATTFMPDTSCNRGQIVTFLWRYAGEKAPEITDNPFTDVFENAFYHKAVLWAVENGVTKGMTDTAFEPETTCSRGQVVTFLFRAAAE